LESDGRVRFDGGSWDLDQYGMPSTGVEILASNKGSSYGRFVLDPVPGTLAPPAARQVAVILVNQVGATPASQARTLQ
jgi:hypothetical protein